MSDDAKDIAQDSIPAWQPCESVHADDLAEIVRQTAPGQTYTFAALYQRYLVIAGKSEHPIAHKGMLGRAFRELGWQDGRRKHGTVRTWTRPEASE